MSDESSVPRPLHSYVLMVSEKNMKSAGGIALPESATKSYAIVKAVGPGEFGSNGERQPLSVKPGDRVMLDAPPGAIGSFYWAGIKYQMVREAYISAVLPGEESMPQPDEASRILTVGPLPPTRLIM